MTEGAERAEVRCHAGRTAFLRCTALLSIPIFEGGKLQAQVRIADLQTQQAVLAYRQVVLSAFHDVDNALVAYAGEQGRSAALKGQLDDAMRSRTLAEGRYHAGLRAYIDVLHAERQLHQVAIALAQSSTAAETNLVALFKALGGGWDAAQALVTIVPIAASTTTVVPATFAVIAVVATVVISVGRCHDTAGNENACAQSAE